MRLPVGIKVGRGVVGVDDPEVSHPSHVGNQVHLYHDIGAFEVAHLDLVAQLLAEGASFIPTAFAIAAGVILLIFAAVKIYNGCFLLKQRAFAQKYAPKKAPQAS